MVRVLAFSHIDADGIFSARLVRLAHVNDAVEVYFKPHDEFDLTEGDLKLYYEFKPDVVYITDLGIAKQTLNIASEMSLKSNVLVIDHHSNLDDVNLVEYNTSRMRVLSDEENCTVGLTYMALRDMLTSETVKWAETWCVLGIYADVADQTTMGKTVLDALLSRHPQLKASQVFWSGEKKVESMYPLPQMVARYWNTARRVALHHGAYVAFKACEELEKIGDVTAVLRDFTHRDQAKYPHLYLLKLWEDDYLAKRNEVFKSDYHMYLDFGDYTVMVFSTHWDLSGYVASVKSSDGKPCFAINMALNKISARGQNSPKHLGMVMRRAYGGGGHRDAASANLKQFNSLTDVLTKLVEVWRQV